MKNKRFIFVDFKEDILKKVARENSEENTIFILPSHLSKRELKKIFQTYYGIRDVLFVTMEELKEMFFETDKPIVKEDKRMLFFYSVLYQEDKNFFHISDYFSAIPFIRDFFSYYTDLYEGNITQNDVFDLLLSSPGDIFPQLKTLKTIARIRQRYKTILKRNGYTDSIFLYNTENIIRKTNYQKAVVVNQFYYTSLEKTLLDIFPQTILYLQLPEEIYDKKNMRLSDKFNTEYIKIPNDIKYFQTNDKTAMYAKMFSDLKDEAAFIVDLDIANFQYKNLLNDMVFSSGANFIKNTRLYDFLCILNDVISSIKNNLFSLKSIANALLSDVFVRYFDFKKEDIEKILIVIYELNEKEIKFIDKNFIERLEIQKDLKDILIEVLAFFEKIIKIKNLKEFIFLFSSDIKIVNIGFEKEEVSEVFYQSLYDIFTLRELFEKPEIDIIDTEPVAFFMKLLLNHLRYKTFSAKTEEKRYFFTSLLDTRNLTFSNIHICNLQNGILPSSPKTSIFLNENQRQKLNLLTYNDLRLREKYYLYRLIASCQKVRLYSYIDMENNIEPSSFVEDLIAHFPEKKIKYEIADFTYKDFFKPIINSESEISVNSYEVLSDSDFFMFESDLKDNIYLSHSKFLQLKYAPFVYYLKHKLNIPFYQTDFSEQYSAAFIGNFVHKVFSEVFKRIKYLYKNPDEKLVYNKEIYGKPAFEKVYQNIKDQKYKKNYNEADIYFDTFFKKFLLDSISNFIYLIFKKIEGSKNIKYIPENEKRGKPEYKYLDTIDNIKIFITGYSDLRIETYKKNYIYDYKTSSVSSFNKIKAQLEFYEYYYYHNIVKEIESAFYFVFDEKLKSVYSKRGQNRLTDIVQSLILDLKKGYSASEKDNEYTDFDITRADKKRG